MAPVLLCGRDVDRALDRSFVRRRLSKRAAWAALAVAGLALAWLVLPGMLRPSVGRARIRTAPVERGRIEAVLEASGTVRPAFERVLSSPVEARIVHVLRRPGETVRPGDEIVELDTSATRLELARLVERLEQKRSERERAGVELEQTLGELASRRETERLEEELLSYRLDQQRELARDGLTSEAALRQAEVELKKAQVGLRQLDEALENARRVGAARLSGIDLESRILSEERDEARRRLDLAGARSDRDGVVTWVPSEEGVAVARGDVLARIADLGSFRVEAQLSDAYASRLAVDQPVEVEVDGEGIGGHVAGIRPTVEQGTVRFDVELDQPSHPALRPQRRVDVLVVTEAHDGALLLPRGTFGGSGRYRQVFVVRGERAFRTEVEVGLSGHEHFEVLAGLAEGDEVVLSDMQDYLHLESIRVR